MWTGMLDLTLEEYLSTKSLHKGFAVSIVAK